MKPLDSFETLTEAQSYSYVNERMISPDMIVSMLTKNDSVISLTNGALTDDKAAGFILALKGSVTEFNLMNSHPVGQGQQQLLSYLESQGYVSAGFKADAIAYANLEIFPYQSTTQEEFDEAKGVEVQLPDSTNEQVIEFAISETVNPQKQVKVLQRYGSTGDLTDWHELNNVSIRFHQDSYKVFIPNCSHEVRELKLISPVALTVV